MIHAIILGVILAVAVFAGSETSPAPAEPPQRPYSCRLLDDAERKCAFGQCDKREIERLKKECL
jgi:hypothetical protein